MDIWPPVDDVTEGSNWPGGEAIYLNGCVLASTPEPSPTSSGTASPSPTLPETGPFEVGIMLISALILIGGGIFLIRLARRL